MASRSSLGRKAVVEFSMNAREEITSQIIGILEGSPSWEARGAGNRSRTPVDGSMSTSVASV